LGSLASLLGGSAWESSGEASGHSSGHSGHTSCSAWVGLVESGHDGVVDIFEFLLFVLELLNGGGFFIGLEPAGDGVQLGLNGLLLVISDLVLPLFVSEGVFDGVEVVFEGVLGVHLLPQLLIFSLELLSLPDEFLDVLLGETSFIVGDGDLVGLAVGLVGGVDVHDAVLVDVEGDFDLGHSPGGGGDAVQVERTEFVVVLGHLAFALEDLDQDAGLVVGVGGEGLGLLGRDRGVPRNEHGHDSAGSLNAQGEWGHVEEQQVLHLVRGVVGQDGGLNGGTIGHGLVGVDGPVGLLAVEELLEELADLGDSRGAADQDDFVHLVLGHA